jgi:hypothetical protein
MGLELHGPKIAVALSYRFYDINRIFNDNTVQSVRSCPKSDNLHTNIKMARPGPLVLHTALVRHSFITSLLMGDRVVVYR